MAYVQRKISFVGTPDTNPETKPVLGRLCGREVSHPPLHRLQEGALVSALALSVLLR